MKGLARALVKWKQPCFTKITWTIKSFIMKILRHTLIQGLFITCSTVNLFCGSVLNRPLISSLAGDERR